jgi:hypothetical protein
LIVGTPEMNGNYIEGFGNNAYDAYVKDLIWAGATYEGNEKDELTLNKSVVKKVTISDYYRKDADGNDIQLVD